MVVILEVISVKKRKTSLGMIFVLAVLATSFGLPFLYAIGVPSFDVVLTALFGEGSIWGVVISLMLIISIALGVGKVSKSYS